MVLPEVVVPLFTDVPLFTVVLLPLFTGVDSLAATEPMLVVVTRYLLSLFTPVEVEPPVVGRVLPFTGRVTVAEP